MKTRLFFCFFVILLSCISSFAQQSQPQMQPLTFWYEYTVNPGKEEEFMNLVKTVGQPVRDKLMADGVVKAWGVETPLLRVPGNATHIISYAVFCLKKKKKQCYSDRPNKRACQKIHDSASSGVVP